MSTGRFEHHIPVLLDQVLQCASPEHDQVWVDCTLGFGGHTEAILMRGAMVVGIDQDPDTLRHTQNKLDQYSDLLKCVRGNFRDLPQHLESLGLDTVDGILADLGVSSKQLDEGARGFSFSKSGPIDMRMSSDGETAEDLMNAGHPTVSALSVPMVKNDLPCPLRKQFTILAQPTELRPSLPT